MGRSSNATDYSKAGARRAIDSLMNPNIRVYVQWLRGLSIEEHEAEIRRLEKRQYSGKKPWEE